MADPTALPGIGPTGGFDTREILKQLMGRADESAAYTAGKEKEFSDSVSRETAARGAQQAALAPKREALKAKLDAGAPAAPELSAPPTPPTPGIDPAQMKETLSLVTALAAFGGALTRAPLTAALNNFSAGVHGLVQGNQQLYQQSVKEFEQNLQKSKAENDSIWKKYEAAREKYGTDIQGLQGELTLIAAETQNPIDMELAKRGDIVSLMKIHETTNNNYNKVLEQTARFVEAAQAHADSLAERRATRQQTAALTRGRIDSQQGTKGWQVFQRPDGTLVRVNSITGETEDIKDSKGLAKPKAGGSAGAGGTNTRNALVKAAGTNALNRMAEIKGDGGAYPTTSVMFGQHGDGVTSRATHAVGQAMLSTRQQQIDAQYASLVDEAIPVFTGGLRGSDAFRRFLLGQVPQPGDDPETANEKMRLFEQNIKGTLNTFSSAYSANPEFHGGAGQTDDALSAEEQEELNRLRAKHGGRTR